MRRKVGFLWSVEYNERKVTGGGGARRRETASRITDVVKAELHASDVHSRYLTQLNLNHHTSFNGFHRRLYNVISFI